MEADIEKMQATLQIRMDEELAAAAAELKKISVQRRNSHLRMAGTNDALESKLEDLEMKFAKDLEAEEFASAKLKHRLLEEETDVERCREEENILQMEATSRSMTEEELTAAASELQEVQMQRRMSRSRSADVHDSLQVELAELKVKLAEADVAEAACFADVSRLESAESMESEQLASLQRTYTFVEENTDAERCHLENIVQTEATSRALVEEELAAAVVELQKVNMQRRNSRSRSADELRCLDSEVAELSIELTQANHTLQMMRKNKLLEAEHDATLSRVQAEMAAFQATSQTFMDEELNMAFNEVSEVNEQRRISLLRTAEVRRALEGEVDELKAKQAEADVAEAAHEERAARFAFAENKLAEDMIRMTHNAIFRDEEVDAERRSFQAAIAQLQATSKFSMDEERAAAAAKMHEFTVQRRISRLRTAESHEALECDLAELTVRLAKAGARAEQNDALRCKLQAAVVQVEEASQALIDEKLAAATSELQEINEHRRVSRLRSENAHGALESELAEIKAKLAQASDAEAAHSAQAARLLSDEGVAAEEVLRMVREHGICKEEFDAERCRFQDDIAEMQAAFQISENEKFATLISKMSIAEDKRGSLESESAELAAALVEADSAEAALSARCTYLLAAESVEAEEVGRLRDKYEVSKGQFHADRCHLRAEIMDFQAAAAEAPFFAQCGRHGLDEKEEAELETSVSSSDGESVEPAAQRPKLNPERSGSCARTQANARDREGARISKRSSAATAKAAQWCRMDQQRAAISMLLYNKSGPKRFVFEAFSAWRSVAASLRRSALKRQAEEQVREAWQKAKEFQKQLEQAEKRGSVKKGILGRMRLMFDRGRGFRKRHSASQGSRRSSPSRSRRATLS
eukprot:TRINITY_DN15832_c0_g1_i1.p1 TRINITY_DN15832_c0_g1~~TRINITY_DN15832_c0_g1_i1.p1  ORF type:complete len:957 (-),score=258.06 TRINITY_DN15832_c0_g1_i1:94-2712(-)